MEDRNGFIWVCTEQGVSKFDGIGFTNFTTKNGLPDNEVLSLFEDAKGRIWFNGFSTEPCYYLNGKIYNSDNDAFLKRIKKFKPKGMCISILVQKNKGIAFYIVENNKKLIISKDAEDIQFIQNLNLTQLYQYLLFQEENRFELRSALTLLKWTKGDTAKILLYQGEPCKQNYIDAPTVNFVHWINLEKHTVIQINRKTNDSTNISVDHVYNNYFCTRNLSVLTGDSLFVVYSDDFTKLIEKVKLPFNYERIIIDRKGNKWLGSFDNGLYFIRNNAPVSYDLPTDKLKGILNIWNSKGKIFLGTETNGLICLNDTGEIERIIKTKDLKRVRGYGFNKTYQFLGADKGLYMMNNDFSNLRIKKEQSVKDIEISDKKEVLVGFSAYSAIIKYDGGDSLIQIDNLRTTAICRRNENEIWLGGLNGIRKSIETDNGYTTQELKLNTLIDNSRIVDIKKDLSGNMWVATDQKGLFFCPIKGPILHFTQDSSSQNKLMSDVCLQILISDDNSIWLATTEGISVFRYPKSDKYLFSVANYTMPDGMPSRTINSINFFQNKIVISGTNGLYYFNEFPIPCNETSETLITQIKVNSTIYDEADLVLPYNKNNLIISYASSFINSGLVYLFKYRIRELGNNWILTNTLEVPLLGLESGNYTFEIAAINSQGLSGKIKTLKFTIATPWFKQTWFILLVIIIVSLSILYYYKLTKEKINLSKDLTLLRLRILRAQMNPHFVFNALSNIKNLVKIKQLESAEEYIGTLSLIMRKSINYSGKEFIQLNKEINYTKDYIEIEKLRFAEKFDVYYTIQLSEDDLQAIFVPPLIIQPLAENAIKHAFKGINYKGRLEIKIERQSNRLLKYSIIDNGKGFNNTKVSIPNHGLGITKERISILYRDFKHKGLINIQSNNQYHQQGTLIEILLPIIID